jgi:hypothetical protein
MDVSGKHARASSAGIWGMTLLIVLMVGLLLGPTEYLSAGWIYVKEAPVLSVGPTPIPSTKGAKVTIAGVGFEPKQELGLRIKMGGVMSDVRHQVKPLPVTNEEGAFASEWVLGAETKLLGPGAHTLTAVNDDGDVLAHAPFVLAQPEKKAKEKAKTKEKAKE